jgi:P-type E1-E2 ATPase
MKNWDRSEISIRFFFFTVNLQISFLFSDKTGTLTENSMNFRAASISGEIFGTLAQNESVKVEKFLL